MCIPVQDEDYEQQDKRGCQLNLKAHRLRLLKRKRLKTEKEGSAREKSPEFSVLLLTVKKCLFCLFK